MSDANDVTAKAEIVNTVVICPTAAKCAGGGRVVAVGTESERRERQSEGGRGEGEQRERERCEREERKKTRESGKITLI